MLKSRHLLGLDGMEKEEIQLILDTARSFREILDRPIKRVPTLQGKTVVNLFYEPSTRTRISFELAEKRMSADIINFTPSTSSVKKGESLIDTVKNIEAMKIDMVVVRHSSPGAAHLLARVMDANILNAGDGGHEHPTQALLDMMTIREKFGRLDGLAIGLIGDISHSRVAMSNIFGLKAMGARVILCGPPTLIPREIERLGVEVSHHIDEVIPRADVLNILRLQLERQKSGLFPSLREYHNYFGITRERLEQASKPVLIMHPGPMNRGLEISSQVADSEHSVILEQVTNGIALRMAVLYLLAGGKSEIR
ncbi:MAG: aspartate carbamoyltransferase catalytic subunit [Calditrichaceae bacterium]|nr:aspartate carbamoyltransferase catalytic subunit [Calditrichia bacterium]NUQ44072.1 aspartate carbamoyltransferase catalytic subunit [Calditrichaceae bacterium]